MQNFFVAMIFAVVLVIIGVAYTDTVQRHHPETVSISHR
jgi:cell division protein FtsN